MIDADLATRLRAAGLPWRPSDGDRFTIPGGELAEDVFVVAEMVIQVQDVPGGATVFKFNGTTEWALDSIDSRRVLWLPREEQLRDASATGSSRWPPSPAGMRSRSPTAVGISTSTPSAYARAVLHVLEER